MTGPGIAQSTGAELTARALLLGERIDTVGLERRDAVSTAPLALRVESGLTVIFRYGVVVTFGLDALAEDQVLRGLAPRVHNPLAQREEEVVTLSAAEENEDSQATPVGDTLRVGPFSTAKLLVIAVALAKSVALAEDERHIAEVFDTVEPWARSLADGRSPGRRKAMIQLVGQALLAQHRVAERVAVGDKPDVLWDRPELERLYARLDNEYELSERAETLTHKLDLIGETVTVMTDLIDTRRSLRLEVMVVVLIVTEIVLTLFELVRGR